MANGKPELDEGFEEVPIAELDEGFEEIPLKKKEILSGSGAPASSEPQPIGATEEPLSITRARQSIERRRQLLEQGASNIVAQEPVYQNPVNQEKLKSKVHVTPLNIMEQWTDFMEESAKHTIEDFKRTASKLKEPQGALAKFRDIAIGTTKTGVDALITAGSVTPAGLAFIAGVEAMRDLGASDDAINKAMSLVSTTLKEGGVIGGWTIAPTDTQLLPQYQKDLLAIGDLVVIGGMMHMTGKGMNAVKKGVVSPETQAEFQEAINKIDKNTVKAAQTHPENIDLAKKEKEILDTNDDLGKVSDEAKPIVGQKLQQLEVEKQQLEQQEVQSQITQAHEQTVNEIKSNLEQEANRPDISESSKEAIKTMVDELKVGDTVEMSVKPKEKEIAQEDRPVLHIGDMEGMGEGAKRFKTIKTKDGEEITLKKNSDGEIYALNKDKEVVGFATKLSDIETDLTVAQEYQQKGIGTELLAEFRKLNPEHPSGGLTPLGKKTIESLSRKQEKIPVEEKEKTPKQKSSTVRYEPLLKIESLNDAHTSVKQYFLGGGRINAESMIKELFGFRKNKKGEEIMPKEEYRTRWALTSKKAPTVDGLAHDLWEHQPETSKLTTEDYRNAIIETLSEFPTKNKMAESLEKSFDKKYNLSEEEIQMEEWFQRQMPEEYTESLTPENVKNIWERLTEEEKQELKDFEGDLTEVARENKFSGIFTPSLIEKVRNEIYYEKERERTKRVGEPEETAPSPEQRQHEERVADAEKQLASAKEKLKSKRAALEKTLQKDTSDLFGERESERGVLFSERTDATQFEKALQPEKLEVESAERELAKLRGETFESTPELIAEPKEIKPPPPEIPKEEVKKTIATTRAYEGEVRTGVKKEIEKLGLTREVEKRTDAKAKAKEFIETVGEETALEAVRNNDVSDAAGAYVWNELIESVDKKLASETNPAKIKELEAQEAELFQEFSRKALSGGRFSSALADIYESSDLGYNLTRQIEKYKERNKGEISSDVEAKFRELDKQLKEVTKKLEEAEAKVVETESKVKEGKIREASKQLANAIRKGKLSRPNVFMSQTPASIVWDGAIEVVAKSVEAGGEVAQAVMDGLKFIQESDWYKGLQKEKQSQADKSFEDWFSGKSDREQKAVERLHKDISELQRKISEKDFEKKPKPEPISNSEIIRLKAEKLRLKNEYDKEFYKSELKNRTKAQKWKDAAWDAWGLTRVLRATGEFSFVGIQNLIYTVSHPVQSAKALRTAVKLMTSEKRTEQFLNQIKSQEYYPEIKESKLSLTEPHAELTAREELFYSDWANMIWNTLGKPLEYVNPKVYETFKAISPFKAVERASVGFLDTMRVLRFLDGKQMLEKQGISFKDNPQAWKDMADVINTFTGRASIGGAERFSKQLTRVFFSPRLWASQIKTATPYAFYHFGKMRAGAEGFKPSIAQKMAIADFSKFVGLTTSMVTLAYLGLQNDNDPNTGVETDPTSSDFGKIKIGDTRIDPWGGRIQNIILISRLLADSIKKSSGKSYPLGTPFKTPTRLELLVEMGTNKLAPSAGMLNRYLSSHENRMGERIDKYGQPYEFSEDLKENLYPIYWGTVADLLKDDPTALDGLLAFYAFFGGGVNVYNKKAKSELQIPEVEIPALK